MRGKEISRVIQRTLRPPAHNPWATEAAAEQLARQGKRREAHMVRREIDPNAEAFALDPMEIWIRAESDSDDF